MVTAAVILASEGANPLLPNWWEVLVTAVAFAVLLFVVKKFIAPTFEKSYTDRVEAIEGGIEKAEEAQAEANALLEQYKAQLMDARTEANSIRETARAEGAQILADLKAKAAEESARITAQAQVQIESERVAAVNSSVPRLALWRRRWQARLSAKHSTMTHVQTVSLIASWLTWKHSRTRVYRSNGRCIEQVIGSGFGVVGT